jgi:hypothetical protein
MIDCQPRNAVLVAFAGGVLLWAVPLVSAESVGDAPVDGGVMTVGSFGTYALDISRESANDSTRFGPGWGARLRLGYDKGDSRLRFCPRLSFAYLVYPNEDEPALYVGHDVTHKVLSVGLSVTYLVGHLEPFLAADAGVIQYTSAGGEEGDLWGVLGELEAGVGFRLAPSFSLGPFVGAAHPRFGGLPGFSGEPERGALTFGLFASFAPTGR